MVEVVREGTLRRVTIETTAQGRVDRYWDSELRPVSAEAAHQCKPMIAIKVDYDFHTTGHHMAECIRCGCAEELIVVGGEDDGVYRKETGALREPWTKVDPSSQTG